MTNFEQLRQLLRHVSIAHHIRGRIRLKVQASAAVPMGLERPQAQAERFQLLFQRIPGVQLVQLNVLARSCTVHYDPQAIPDRAWSDLLSGVASEVAQQLECRLQTTCLEYDHAQP